MNFRGLSRLFCVEEKNIFICTIFFFSLNRITFIADERFHAFFKDTTKEWVLQIKYVQERDAGIYECQVSTEPKVSARARLQVIGEYLCS